VTAKRLQVIKAGERTNSTGKPVGNLILLSIPDAEYLQIRRQLEFLDLPNHLSLHELPKKQRFVYFLNRGLASMVVAMREGKNVEAGLRKRRGRRCRLG